VPKVTICDTHCVPYLCFYIFDDTLASILTKVHVEVRHGYALGIQEPLEQQLIAATDQDR